MRLPAIAVSRWAINAEGNVYRLDGYVGIGTDSPSGMLGLGDELTYITVNSNGEITFTDAVSGTQSLSTFAQSANNIADLNEAIQTILKDLDGYTNVNTDLEHYIQHSDAIQTILKDLDGYATTPSDGSSSDGYVAFFVGSRAIAGDNDFYYNRETSELNISGIMNALKFGQNGGIGATSDGTLYLTNNAGTGFTRLVLGSTASTDVGFDVIGNNIQVRNNATTYRGIYASNFIAPLAVRGFVTEAGGVYASSVTGQYTWSDQSAAGAGILDTGLRRFAPAVVAITNGGLGLGDLIVDNFNVSGNISSLDSSLTLVPIDGYVIPLVDDGYSLGSVSTRWKELWLGPSALHIKSNTTQTETGVERDWNFTIDSAGALRIRQDGDTFFRINQDTPSISIGPTIPPAGITHRLVIDGAIGGPTYSGSYLLITKTGDGNAGSVLLIANNDVIIGKDVPANAMIVKQDGSVGIGTNTPSAKFHVVGDGYFDGYLMPFTDDTWGLGTPDKRWRDLYLGPGSLHIISTTAQTETGVERDWTIGASSDGSLAIKQGADYLVYINQDGQFNIASNIIVSGATQIIDAGNKLSIKGITGIASGNAYFVATDAAAAHTTYQGVTATTGFTGTFTASPFEIRTSNAPKITIAAVTGVTMNTSLNVGIVNQSDQLAHFFSASTAGHSWFVGDKNLDQLAFVVGSEHGQQLVFGPAFSDTTDFFHPIQSDPMMYFHSMTDPGVDPNQWLSISHRKTSGYVETGLGSILLAPFDGYTSPAVDDAYSLGSPSLRWKDLWLSDASLHLVQNANENDTGVNRQWDFRINSAGDLLVNEASDNIMKLASPGGTSTISTALSVTGTLIGPNFQTTASSVILGTLVFTNGPFAFSSGEQSPIFALNQTFDQFGWFGASNCGNQFIFGMQVYYTTDYQHPDQGNPTLFLHSSGDPALDPSQWMSMVHNSVDGYIATGIGNIILAPAGTAGDAYVEVTANLIVDGQAYSKLSTTNTPAAATHTINWNLGNNQVLDLSSATTNITLAFINAQPGATYTIKIIQHPTTPVNVIWPGAVKWPGGVAPTISTGASAVDLATSFFDGANYYSNIGQNYS